MSRQVTIDVEARFVDHISNESKAASKSVEEIGKSAEKSQKQINNLSKKKPIFDADNNKFLNKVRTMEAKMKKLGHTKTAAVLDAIDKVTPKVGRILNKVQSLTQKTWRASIDFKDGQALASVRKLTSGVENLTRKTWTTLVKVKDMALSPIKAIKNALFSIPTLITAVISAKVIQKGVLEPISLADQYSGAKIGFSTLLGDSAGQAMMDEIDLFAKKTPFKTSGVISNVQKMMAYGWDVDRVIEDMETIGDAAASTGRGDQGLESIVYALSEIRSKGKLSTQELNQLASAGIKAKYYLAQGLGFGTDDAGLKKLAEALEDGAVGANQAIDLILEGMKEFDGMMDRTANETVSGLKSQLEDVFEINIARRWGQGLQDGARRGLGTIVELLDGADESLGALGDTLYELGQTAANWVADKLESVVKKIQEITDSFEFKNASLGDKVSMLWEGVVKDPLKKWWDETGKAAVTDTAKDIGLSIGKGILSGIEMAWNALPWWGKLLVGGYAAGKTVSGVGNVIAGAQNLFGAAKGVIGSAGGYTLAGTGGMYMAQGGGILGTLSKVGYKALGAGGLGVGGGTAALYGGLTVAGVGGAIKSSLHAMTTGYKALESLEFGDKTSAATNGAKFASTTAGLIGGGFGAAGMAKLGGTIGTFFGGPIGTVVGAGLGGLAGMFLGDKIAKRIEAARYETEAMQEAVKKGASAEEMAAAYAEERWLNAKEHFGDIKLSMEEITRLANQMVWGDDLEYFEKFTASAKAAEASLETLKSSSEDTNRWMWKASLGVKFNEDEKEAFKLSFDDYINSAKSLLENKHYEFAMAAELVLDTSTDSGKSILEGGNAFYAKAQQDLEAASTELGNALTSALADGIINADEQAAISAAQQKVASIMERIADAEMKAELKLAEIKLKEGNMDADSYSKFIETMSNQLQERIDAQDEAVKILLTNIELEYTDENGNITNKEEYEAKVQEVLNQHKLTLDGIKAEILNFELEPLADAYDLDMGFLKTALLKAAVRDPLSWDDATLKTMLNTDELSAASADNIREALSNIATQSGKLDVDINALLKPKMEAEAGLDKVAKTEIEKQFVDGLTIKPSLTIDPVISSINKVYIPRSSLFTLTGSTETPINNYRGGIVGYSDGGMVRGGSQLIEVAEEGSPEMIIPLSSQRRGRGLKLWAQAGNIMGVPGFARGGMTTGGNDEGIRFQSFGSSEAPGGQSVQVDIGGLTFEINVSGGDSQSIVETIKAQATEIADVVAGVLADSLGAQFENTPARGGVA